MLANVITAAATAMPEEISSAMSDGLSTAGSYVTSTIGTALPVVLGVVGLGVAAGVIIKWVRKIKG